MALEGIGWFVESSWQEIVKEMMEEHADGRSVVWGCTSVVKHWALLKVPQLQVFKIERNSLVNV